MLITFFIEIFSAVIAFLSFHYGGPNALTASFFIAWLLLTVFPVKIISVKLFGYHRYINITWSVFLVIWLLGFFANVFCAWFALNDLTILLALILTSIFIWAASFYLNKINIAENLPAEQNEGIGHKIHFVLFSLLTALGFLWLAYSVSGNYFQSPWQVLPWGFAVITSLLFGFLIFLIFSSRRPKNIFWLILLFSLLVHSYLLVFQNGFGGDRLRHVGSEYRILRQQEYQPTLLADNLWQTKIGPLSVPSALISQAKISYGFEWSLGVIVAKAFGLDPWQIDRFILPLLWSLLLPGLFYLAAINFWPRRGFAYLAALAPSFFYLFQYYGAQTLPIGYGVMFYIFMVGLWLLYLKQKDRRLLVFLIALTVLSYFSYSLSFVGCFVMLAAAFTLNLKKVWWLVVGGVLSISLFLADLFSAGNFLAINFSPRLLAANIFKGDFLFFSQIIASANLSWLKWPTAFYLIVFLSLIVYSVIKLVKINSKTASFIFINAAVLAISYLLDWQFISGLHTIGRRLNAFLLVWLALLFFWLVYDLVKTRKAVKIIAVLLSLVFLFNYLSGPVLNAQVSSDEVAAVKYIWSQIEKQPQNYCIVANTWPLLVMEAFSGKMVVAGNFESDFNHQQAARVGLFEKIISNPEISDFSQARFLTKTDYGFLLIDARIINKDTLYKLQSILGQPLNFGANLLWRFGAE